jgi:hypothetical protein
VNFKQSIVGDSIKYVDKNNKSKGYNVINGKKRLDIGHLAILTGGRGNTLKKSNRHKGGTNMYAQTKSVTVE